MLIHKLKRHLPVFLLCVFYVLVKILNDRGIINNYVLQVLMYIGINITMTVGLNLINGITGQPCLGYAAFMSLGAYGASIVTTMVFDGHAVPPVFQSVVFILALIVGGMVAAAFAFVIALPTLKVKGDYLAIVTLAFGEVVRAVLRLVEPIGASRGMVNIPAYTNLGWILAIMAITLWIAKNFIYSKYGRACIAIRENEIASNCIGINLTGYKVLAFVIAAFIAGVAGGLYSHMVTYIQPDTFSSAKSSEYLVYLYAGGVGTLTGSIIGATILTAVPEVLRFLSKWRMVLYAVILVCVMVFKPLGLAGGREFSFLKIKRSDLYESWTTGKKKKNEKLASDNMEKGE